MQQIDQLRKSKIQNCNYSKFFEKNKESYQGSLDPITLDDVVQPNDHNGFIYVNCGNAVKIFNIDSLCKYLDYNMEGVITNPLTRQVFTREEINYFRFHKKLYDLSTQENLSGINLNIVYENLVNFFNERVGTIAEKWKEYWSTDMSIYAHFLKIENFSSHFKDFKYDEKFAKSERIQAENKLNSDNKRGNWLIRYCSINRNNPEECKKLGKCYYAISVYIAPNQIGHILISYQAGFGWRLIASNQSPQYYCSFIKLIEKLTITYDLDIVQQISGYVNICNL